MKTCTEFHGYRVLGRPTSAKIQHFTSLGTPNSGATSFAEMPERVKAFMNKHGETARHLLDEMSGDSSR